MAPQDLMGWTKTAAMVQGGVIAEVSVAGVTVDLIPW
jgi:hypothetical protein